MRTIEKEILSEFAAHYLGDALAVALQDILPLLAKNTAARLEDRVHGEDRQQLIELLYTLRDDPHHPLHGHISNATGIHWPDMPDTWADFRRLMELVIAELEKE